MLSSYVLLFLAAAILLCARITAAKDAEILLKGSSRHLGHHAGTSKTTHAVQLVGTNLASCDLTLLEHADHLLASVKSQTLFVSRIIASPAEFADFSIKVTTMKSHLRAEGCSQDALLTQLHAEFDYSKPVPTTVFLGFDKPALLSIPLFRGEMSKLCRIRNKVEPNELSILFLEGIDITQEGMPAFAHDARSTELVLQIGARDISFDVEEDAFVRMSAFVKCANNDSLGGGRVLFGKDITVKMVRQELSKPEYSVGLDGARSFLVSTIHRDDF